MQKERFKILMEKFLEERLNASENDELSRLLSLEENKEHLDELVFHAISDGRYTLTPSENTKASIQEYLKKRIRPVPVIRHWWAAAAVFFVVAVGAYIWFASLPSTPIFHTSRPPLLQQDVLPGQNGAILTLANGSIVVLDSLGEGIIAEQSGIEISLNNGQVSYNRPTTRMEQMLYNTMTTPRGRQFNLRLPDGTQVWLNAASSIRYPVVFSGKDRRVEITGEVYFEVAKDLQMPFKVATNNNLEIEVLGTSFNINAYKNEEAVSTTLLEGAVRVSVNSGKESARWVLKPGQQLSIGGSDRQDVNLVENADTDKVVAWKNGFFNFEGAQLVQVMRELERWYNIEVVYPNGIPDITFGGELTKDISLNTLLAALQLSKVKLRLEGDRKLVILQ